MVTINNYEQLINAINENTRKVVQEEVAETTRGIVRDEVSKVTREILHDEVPKLTREIVREEVSSITRAIVREEISDALERTLTKAKAHTDDQFNWIANQMMEGFESLDKKIDSTAIDLRREMVGGFDRLDKKLDFIKYNYGARIELLEEKGSI